MLGHEVVIALDVGGSSLKSGLIKQGVDLESFHETPYDSLSGVDHLHDIFVREINRLWHPQPSTRVVGIGVSMPGPFDYTRGISYIRGQSKFEALYGESLPNAWRRRAPYLTEVPIEFVNDAHAFALGNLDYSAAALAGKVLFVTLGTGCGSAFAENGRLLTGGPGVPESGYIYDLPYGSSRIDDVLSSRGVASLWKEQGGGEEPVHEIARLGYRGVAEAKQTWHRFGVLLIDALRPTLLDFRPDSLVLGGKISKSFDLFSASAQEGLASLEHATDLRSAKHIDGAALLGAGRVVLERLRKTL